MVDQKKKNNETNSQPVCPNMSRRNFLKGIGTGAVAGVVAPAILPLAGCDGGGGGATGVLQLSVPPPPTGTATVSIVRKSDVEEMVRTAIDMAGGLDEIQSGDTVVIKPNLTMGGPEVMGARAYTSPQVIRAVIKLVKERTQAKNITVAEASAFGGPTKSYARSAGILAVVNAEGANFVEWQKGPYTKVQCRDFDYLKWAFHVPTSIAMGQFDHFINVPVLKNHEMVPTANVQYTCCIKAHVGVLKPSDRLTGGGTGIHTRNLGEIVAELSLAAPVKAMNVVDALSIVLAGGPSPTANNAKPGLILASKDQVAADSLALAVLRYYAKQRGVSRPYVRTPVWEQASIMQAQKLNLGRSRQNIVVADESVSEISGILSNWS